MTREPDLIVIGGGLAGLTAAARAAQQGLAVAVFEQASRLGGRAATQVRDGVALNLGPHALYRDGHAARLLRELDVPFRGRVPNPGRTQLTLGPRSFAPPQGILSLLASRLLTLREKARLGRFFGELSRLDAAPWHAVPLADWVRDRFGPGNLNALLRALFRVTTYGDDPTRMSAGAAIEQFRLGLRGNVWYLDGGWQTLIDGLRDRATELGVAIHPGVLVTSIHGDQEGVTVQTKDGATWRSGAAILAASPQVAIQLLGRAPESPLARWAAHARPAKVACLDVALRRLPRSGDRFALGLDRPLYFSVHSAAARLGPNGVAVLHVMKYLGSEPTASPNDNLQEMEAFLDRLQPGWRDLVLTRRFLPSMTAAHALPRADENGLAGRPDVDSSEHPNVYLAGDWIGPRGLLADAAAASAEAAVHAVRTRERSVAHV